MSYQSKYTGEEVDSALNKANTAIQQDNLSTVATTGSYLDLSNLPDIPQVAREAMSELISSIESRISELERRVSELEL